MTKLKRALLIDRLPNAELVSYGATVGSTVSGSAVANVGLVRSLLRYGSFDAYFYMQESPLARKEAMFAAGERLQGINLGNAESLPNRTDELVLFATSQHLAKYVPVRQFFGRYEWPISGLAYGLSLNWLIPQHVWNVFSSTGPQDVLICTSHCHRRAMEAIDDQIVNSSSVAAVRKSGLRYRYHVLPLGVEPETVSSSSESLERGLLPPGTGFVALSIGRLSTALKVDLHPLIHAFITCDDLPRNSLLVIAGDDPRGQVSGSLQLFANTIPGPNRVLVLPQAAAVRRQLIALADVMLCLSDNMQESFGLVVVEGMLGGLPVVAPDWNGYGELIEHGVHGFLVPTAFMADTQVLSAFAMLIDPGFSLCQRVVIDTAAMMSALVALARNPDLRKDMGAEGKRSALARFAWETLVPRYEELWHEQIQQGRRNATPPKDKLASYYDFDEAFGHYAGRRLTADTVIDTAHVLRATNMATPSTAGFDPAIDTAILKIAAQAAGLKVSDLVAHTDLRAIGSSQVMTQVARLLKYGLLTLCPPLSDQPSKNLHLAERP